MVGRLLGLHADQLLARASARCVSHHRVDKLALLPAERTVAHLRGRSASELTSQLAVLAVLLLEVRDLEIRVVLWCFGLVTEEKVFDTA